MRLLQIPHHEHRHRNIAGLLQGDHRDAECYAVREDVIHKSFQEIDFCVDKL